MIGRGEVKQPAVSSMASRCNGTLSPGMTTNLVQRVVQHQEGAINGFTRQYGGKFLVYYELDEEMLDAIAREKQIKAGSRRKKSALIEGMNPRWAELHPTII